MSRQAAARFSRTVDLLHVYSSLSSSSKPRASSLNPFFPTAIVSCLLVLSRKRERCRGAWRRKSLRGKDLRFRASVPFPRAVKTPPPRCAPQLLAPQALGNPRLAQPRRRGSSAAKKYFSRHSSRHARGPSAQPRTVAGTFRAAVRPGKNGSRHAPRAPSAQPRTVAGTLRVPSALRPQPQEFRRRRLAGGIAPLDGARRNFPKLEASGGRHGGACLLLFLSSSRSSPRKRIKGRRDALAILVANPRPPGQARAGAARRQFALLFCY